MKNTQRIISFILLIIISVSNLATPVAYAARDEVAKAQPAASAQNSKTLAPVPTVSQPGHGSVLGESTSLLTVGTQPLDLQDGNTGSAHERIPLRMQQLTKKVYQTDEDVTLAVTDPDNEAFTTTVKDATGSQVPVPITESNDGTTTTVDLAPSNEIKPGKYQVAITDQEGNTTTQDFSWGVLALNFDKSLYHPDETSDIGMAVLNDKGDMVCDARVSLQVSNQALGINDMLSTANASSSADENITVNPQCQSHDFSLSPDYEAHYHFRKEGMYNFQLTAVTANGTHTISDSIKVTNDIPFDVQRVSATRIYPPNTYPMTFNITAHKNFSGTVTETVPEDFTITPATQSALRQAQGLTTQSYDNMQTVYLNSNDPAAQLQEAITASGSGGLVMPFQGNYPITQGFGAQLTDPTLQAFYTQYGLAGHDGVDFGVPMDTPLYAVDDGNIIWSGPGDYGITIIIQHSWGESYYGHLSNTSVTVGEHVTKGQLLGYSGESGEATGPHLHFGMKPNKPDMTNGYYGKVDPLPYLPYGHAAEATTGIGPSIELPGEQNTLGASTSADTTDASSSATTSPTPTVTPTLLPSESPTPSGVSPTILPSPTEALGISPTPIPSASSGSTTTSSGSSTTPNENFSVLDDQIRTNEELANNADTQRVKVITWHVSLKKGDSTTLGYDFQTPLVSPQFYLLGPMQFYASGSNKVVFQEQRQWQIASDDVGVEWYSNSTGNKWNGYSWQYRKKIDINHGEVSTTPTMPTATFMESGSDATQDLSFYNQSTGSACISDTTIAETGPRSIRCSTGGTGVASSIGAGNVLSDSGSRFSLYVNFANFGTGSINFLAAGTTISSAIFALRVTTAGVLQLTSGGGTLIGTGSTLSTGTWYRISVGYTITSTTTYTIKVYVNGGSPNISVSNSTALPNTGTNTLSFGEKTAGVGNNLLINIDDIYVDNGSDLSDPGNIHVTAKRPFANGTTNQFTTQINNSDAGSGYGSGHAPQVNEQPLNVNAGWSISTTTKETEEYNVESASTGDVNLTGDSIINTEGWIYADEASTSNTPVTHIIVNGVATSKTLTTSAAMYTTITGFDTYPAGAGADIGMDGQYTSTPHLYSLFEAGIQVAYMAPSGSLSSFPVLVNLTSDPDLSAHAQSSGADILFTDSTGENLLPFEIESYSSGSLVAWVNISSLSATSDTIIYMYFGNPSASSLANAPNTWNNNYGAVWHFSNQGGTLGLSDSTSNGNTATNAFSSTTTTGEIGGGVNFNGSNQSLSAANNNIFNPTTSSFSTTAWVNTSNDTIEQPVIGHFTGGGAGWIFAPDSSAVGTLNFSDGTNIISPPVTGTLADSTWEDIGFVRSGTTLTFYQNGASLGSGTTVASIPSETNTETIGLDNDGGNLWIGSMDEIEYSNTALSPGWIQTEYNNQNAPGSFYSLGSVETKIYAPQLSQLMRNGQWFNSEGQIQPFTY